VQPHLLLLPFTGFRFHVRADAAGDQGRAFILQRDLSRQRAFREVQENQGKDLLHPVSFSFFCSFW
jgi:hypothetical protein